MYLWMPTLLRKERKMRSTISSGRTCTAIAWLTLTLTAFCLCSGTAIAQDTPIPASAALTSAGCNGQDLSDGSDSARNDPVWTPILKDPLHPFPSDVTILEGRVLGNNEKFQSRTLLPRESTTDQAPSEVAEEDLPWNHFTHDKTLDVVPDPGYKHLLSSFVLADGTVQSHEAMEVEWENGSVGSEVVNDNIVRAEDFVWGGLPTFAWASVGDRVWIAGRWIFDCGHPGSGDVAHVEYSTEIHPPRVMVVFRLNHRVSLLKTGLEGDQATGEAAPSTWLPVTGGSTILPVTEADILVSGNGGGANDICNLINRHISIVSGHIDDCALTSPVIPVNDRNYVFDVYPPGTNFDPSQKQGNGNYPVNPPSSTAALQWKIIDRFNILPTHTCGKGASESTGAPCVTVDPILCLVDNNTKAPTQDESTTCPDVPAFPTRLRVILPFKGSSANAFAQSILLGWDDVPGTQNDYGVQGVNQTNEIRLHKLTVLKNGESFLHDGDWRVFTDVGGQWRYLSDRQFFDQNSSGDNVCHGDSLLENGDSAPDCFQFDNHPWIVSTPPGMPIHVAVGGYESDDVDSHFCYQVDNYFNGGTCEASILAGFALLHANDDRLGTLEFDLDPSAGYQQIVPGSLPYDASSNGLTFETVKLDDACNDVKSVTNDSGKDCGIDGLAYRVEFTVTPVAAPSAPTSSALKTGSPSYTDANTQTLFVGASTALSVSTSSTSNVGFQYRFIPDGGAPPTYNLFVFPFPFHWLWTDFAAGPRHDVPLNGGFGGDGGYTIQYSAEADDCGNLFACGLTEPRHSTHLVLDTTPPVSTIVQPAAASYPHSATLTLGYSLSDGNGSGVASFTPTMDGSPTLPDGHGLSSGQSINLLTEMTLGTHVFSISATDNVGNTGSTSVTFTVIVTPDSIKGDVSQFLGAGKIKNNGEANSLLAKLNAAANARAAGRCDTANNIYQAFINELNAQSGKGVDAAAAAIMIADALYLIAHCP
jgi:hypothetical protein